MKVLTYELLFNIGAGKFGAGAFRNWNHIKNNLSF
jgi:hypothetical protein